jgi:hypothetical protein
MELCLGRCSRLANTGEYWRIDTSVGNLGVVDYWVYGSDVLAMCNVWARGCRAE